MAWTAPRTWVASELVTASIMNTHVKDNLTILRSTGVWTEDSSIAATKKLYFDGVGNTYITERAADVLNFTVGGVSQIDVSGTVISLLDDVAVPATKLLYLDGGFDTYIQENSANVLRCVAGGSGGVDLTSGATAWAAVSDERLKVIIEAIGDGTAKVAALRPVIGRFQDDPEDRRRAFLIAQDVQRVLPEAVTEGEDGMLRLAYTDVIPLLVAALQEQTARLAAVEQDQAELRAQLAARRALVEEDMP